LNTGQTSVRYCGCMSCRGDLVTGWSFIGHRPEVRRHSDASAPGTSR
jgi:hypothetical protein